MPSSKAVKPAWSAALSCARVSAGMAKGPAVSGCWGRVRGTPMAGDVDAAADPHVLMGLDVIQEFLQRAHAPWAAQQAAVHADAQHLGAVQAVRVTFRIEYVEGVAQVGKKSSPCEKPCGRQKRMSFVSMA